MKRLFFPLLLAVLLAIPVIASSQIFGVSTTSTNYTVIVGVTNSPPYSSNAFYVAIPAFNINLTNVDSTETFTGLVYVVFPAMTNVIAGFTNSFSGYTNSNWSTNTTAGAVAIQGTFFMSAGIGTKTNGVYVH